MPVSGYDPDDLDDRLEELMEPSEFEELLTPAERERHEHGESLVDLLDDEEIHRLLRRGDET